VVSLHFVSKAPVTSQLQAFWLVGDAGVVAVVMVVAEIDEDQNLNIF